MNKKNYSEAQKALSKGSLIAEKMTEESWGKAYPGNDPRIYGIGLSAMRMSFASNLQTVNAVITNHVDKK
jgi:hypothetical protein